MMNETLDRIIKQSGAMWEAARSRTEVFDAVLVKLSPGASGNVFELTLPPNEHHPFWRVNERAMTAGEEEYLHTLLRQHGASNSRWLFHVGNFDPEPRDDGTMYRVRALIYNGRKEHGWLPSTEIVRATFELIDG